MAGRTSDRLVRGDERKPSLVMIERLEWQPRLFAVAVLTFGAEAAFVWFCRSVTIDARFGRIAILRPRRVTAFAPGSRVGAGQSKGGQFVIERLPVERGNHDIPSLVVGVAVSALLARR